MKHCCIFLFLLLFLPGFSQENKITSVSDSIFLNISTKVSEIESHQQYSTYHSVGKYKMYHTQNTYNILQLDTQTGKVWQVQWALDVNEEFAVVINDKDLSAGTIMPIGTYELYPTENIYQFILLNTISGQSWHLQWGFDPGKRWIRPIS